MYTAEGNGPVNAIDTALRAALARRLSRSSTGSTSPTTRCASSTAPTATGAVTRVLIDATDGERDWTTIGVSPNIIEASWRALEESIVYGLLHAAGVDIIHGRAEVRPDPADRRGPRLRVAARRARWVGARSAGGDHRLPAGRARGSAIQGRTRAMRSSWPRRSPTRSTSCQGSGSTTSVGGVLGIALRRASEFSRAPVIHDLTIAFTIWGFLDRSTAGRSRRRAARRGSPGSATSPTTTSRRGHWSTRCPTTTLRMTPGAGRCGVPGTVA